MKAIWRIELLGELRVQHAERVITRFPTQKTAVLLAYLAYYHQHPHPRDALIDQLWPEIDLDAARSSLRSALYSLRQLLEHEDAAAGNLLIASRSTVSLHPDAFTTDVADFRAALHSAGRSERPTDRAARLSGALAGYRGELLPGSYEPWILQERRFLAEAYLDGLHQLVTALEQDGELERALEVARQAVSTDPLRDEAHFDLMRLYAAAGQPSAVLRQYQELERLLRQELGEPPSAAARALADELRQRADDVACHRAPKFNGENRLRQLGQTRVPPNSRHQKPWFGRNLPADPARRPRYQARMPRFGRRPSIGTCRSSSPGSSAGPGSWPRCRSSWARAGSSPSRGRAGVARPVWPSRSPRSPCRRRAEGSGWWSWRRCRIRSGCPRQSRRSWRRGRSDLTAQRSATGAGPRGPRRSRC